MSTILSESTAPGDVRSRPVLTTRLLAVLAGLAALGMLSTNIMLPSFPSMAADLGVGTRDMGWTLSGFFLAFALGQLFVGPASDRWGRRAPVIAGLVLLMVPYRSVRLPSSIPGSSRPSLARSAADPKAVYWWRSSWHSQPPDTRPAVPPATQSRGRRWHCA
jgi:hypothetical protein